jgi:hypothetical protein
LKGGAQVPSRSRSLGEEGTCPQILRSRICIAAEVHVNEILQIKHQIKPGWGIGSFARASFENVQQYKQTCLTPMNSFACVHHFDTGFVFMNTRI